MRRELLTFAILGAMASFVVPQAAFAKASDNGVERIDCDCSKAQRKEPATVRPLTEPTPVRKKVRAKQRRILM